MAAIGRRQNLWREIYPQLAAFCNGEVPVPRIDFSALRKQQVPRASAMVMSFVRLKQRAPGLVRPIYAMLHPDIDSRPRADQGVDMLEGAPPRTPLSDDAIIHWLEAKVALQRRLEPRALAEPRSLPMGGVSPLRRHTLEGATALGPWEEGRLGPTLPTERRWQVEDLCQLSSAWLRSVQAEWSDSPRPPSPVLSELSALSSTMRLPPSEASLPRDESSDSLATLPSHLPSPTALFRARSWCKPAKFVDRSRRHSLTEEALAAPQQQWFWQRALEFSRRRAASSRSKRRTSSQSSSRLQVITENLSSWMFSSNLQASPQEEDYVR